MLFPALLFYNLPMRDDFLKAAMAIVKDPNVLINIVSKRVKQLKFGSQPMVESLEKLSNEDIALKEIMDGALKFTVESTEGPTKVKPKAA